jgi:hypothetical protein
MLEKGLYDELFLTQCCFFWEVPKKLQTWELKPPCLLLRAERQTQTRLLSQEQLVQEPPRSRLLEQLLRTRWLPAAEEGGKEEEEKKKRE